MTTDTDNNVPIGSVGTTTGKIPETINDFSVSDTSLGKATYTDENGNTVLISHSKSGQHGRRRKYSLTLRDSDGEKIQTRNIDHGPYTDRDIHDATDAIKTQLWEWARFDINDREPIHTEIEELGEPNPHPPGESPTLSNAWYFTFSQKQKSVSDTNASPVPRETYVPSSRYEFMASNETANWYCGQLVVTFNQEPPDSITKKDNCVYGTYIYLSLTPLKPVDERINQHDTKEINRRCIHHDDPHEHLSYDALLETINQAQEELVCDAEAIGDEHREEIIKDAERRLNEETGEYEEQIRLTGF